MMRPSNHQPPGAHPQQVTAPQMVPIPSGSFWMGTSDRLVQHLLLKEEWAQDWYSRDLFLNEQPIHTVSLPAYEIARNPVTNAEYYRFVWDTGHRAPRGWIGLHFPIEQENHPVAGVTRADALSYCRWLGEQTGQAYRLPTEAEWERASRGDDDRIYPWGNEFIPWRCNTMESGKQNSTAVGEYSPSGDSPFGVADMAGNVWEWTSSWLQPYPYRPEDGREGAGGMGKCVVRGGAWNYSRKLARCSAREGVLENFVSSALGFRLARNP